LTTELTSPNLARNAVAYRCFGYNDPAFAAYRADPSSAAPPAGYGLLDTLRPTQLTDCDVPLAVLSWTATDGIRFLDRWSVRRGLTAPSPAGNWAPLHGGRRRAEAEAMFLQFQEHIAALRSTLPKPDTVVATQHFRYLPPVGLLPLKGGGAAAGFAWATFFQ